MPQKCIQRFQNYNVNVHSHYKTIGILSLFSLCYIHLNVTQFYKSLHLKKRFKIKISYKKIVKPLVKVFANVFKTF